MTTLSVVGQADSQVPEVVVLPDWLPGSLQEFADGWKDTGVNILVSQEMIDAFADLIGDRQPIHVDADAARKAGLRGTIAHGHLVLAQTKRLLPVVGMLIQSGIVVIRKSDNPCNYTDMLFSESVISARARIASCRLKRSGDAEIVHEYQVIGVGYEKPIIEGSQVLICRKPELQLEQLQ